MSAGTFVVADAHGNAAQVRGLLEHEGLIEQDYGVDGAFVCAIRKRPEVTVVQLGDLANCVASSINDDLEALGLVESGLIDFMLVGNHEHPYFGGPPFSGFWPDPAVRNVLHRINNRGGMRAAHAADGWLVTHAGLTSERLRSFHSHEQTAEGLARRLNDVWRTDPKDQVFSAIGRERGGWSPEGGILWSDWREPKPRNLRQLVGHTVGDDIRRRSSAVCIDLGGGKGDRIAGAWIHPDGVETVEVSISARAGVL